MIGEKSIFEPYVKHLPALLRLPLLIFKPRRVFKILVPFNFFVEFIQHSCVNGRVYFGVKTCEGFLWFNCSSVVRVRVYYVDFFVFFLFLRHW